MSPVVPLLLLVLLCFRVPAGFSSAGLSYRRIRATLQTPCLRFISSRERAGVCRASCCAQRLISSSYSESERIRFLRQQILDQRRTVGKALRMSAARNRADRGGGGRGSRLQALLLRLPGGAYLSHLLGLSPSVTCLACGEVVSSAEDNMVACDVPQCTGVYCRPCFYSLGNTCIVCMRPLTFQEDGEEELDSSDDEQLSLWSAALNSSHITDPQARGLMRRRIFMATRRRPTGRSDSGDKRKDGGNRRECDSSGHISVHSDSELSEADMTYQDGPRSEESDSDASLHSATSRNQGGYQDESIITVVVHRPGSPPNLQDSPGASRAQSPGPEAHVILCG
uniref:E3 ubiquitin-protein ligase DCST1-like C-terminal domain-containing protein n=1 Tax=Monopterus albus TaxID=43700 RepID=A0A3Q3QYX8_MONAL